MQSPRPLFLFISLFPRKGSPQEFQQAAEDIVQRFLADITYLAESRPEEFAKILAELPKRLQPLFGEYDAYKIQGFLRERLNYLTKSPRR
jgi:hypothetical protein